MSDKEAVQRTDCDTKGDIAKVKELSLKANRAVSFSSEDAWVKSLGIPPSHYLQVCIAFNTKYVHLPRLKKLLIHAI